jgi:hypothetical protein
MRRAEPLLLLANLLTLFALAVPLPRAMRHQSDGSGCTTSHQVGFSRGVLP